MLQGQLVTHVTDYEVVNIVNLTKEIGAINDFSGYFAIKATIVD